MAKHGIEKQLEGLLKKQKRLGVTLVNEEKKANKLRDARLIRLGVLAEQMFKGGDLQLLGRFETVALEQYKDRKFDRLAFGLDEPLNWFDEIREEAMVAKAQKGETAKAPSSTSASVAGAPAGAGGGGTKPAAGAAARPSSGSSNGTSAAPGSTASA